MKKIFIAIGIVVLFLVGGKWWSNSLEIKQLKSEGVPASEIISQNGIHIHPQIEIYIGGKKQDILANIGIGSQYASLPTYDMSRGMTAMHTHDRDGVIHIESSGIVTKDDTKLSTFFLIWGKDFMGFGSSVSLIVNEEINTDLENYEMEDGDKIVLMYE